MPNLNFFVGYSTTLSGAQSVELSSTVYTEDLGLCDSCVEITLSCWACLTTEQKVFYDDALLSPVDDGYYVLIYESGNRATWYIVGGYPQGGGFYN